MLQIILKNARSGKFFTRGAMPLGCGPEINRSDVVLKRNESREFHGVVEGRKATITTAC